MSTIKLVMGFNLKNCIEIERPISFYELKTRKVFLLFNRLTNDFIYKILSPENIQYNLCMLHWLRIRFYKWSQRMWPESNSIRKVVESKSFSSYSCIAPREKERTLFHKGSCVGSFWVLDCIKVVQWAIVLTVFYWWVETQNKLPGNIVFSINGESIKRRNYSALFACWLFFSLFLIQR